MTKKSKKNIVTFEEECDVNKISATTVLDQRRNTVTEKALSEVSECNEDVPPKKRKKKKLIQDKMMSNDDENKELMDIEEKVNSAELNSEHKVEPKESIREKKRKKHAKLMEIQKSKADINAQQIALNYLSKWKHARSEWKFEKLKQIWLSENLFEPSKIPDDMWLTAVEYFSCSKGFIRKLIIREALKVIDAVDPSNDADEESQIIKSNRARDIVQNLKED